MHGVLCQIFLSGSEWVNAGKKYIGKNERKKNTAGTGSDP